MCTVTYLPIPNGFILTHSRDEKAIRPVAWPPKEFRIGGRSVTFPQDPQGSGTWIAVSATLTICLLNGAFMPHQPQPPYKHSRGLVVLDAFDYVSIDSFIQHYPFTGLEPFTLLLTETGRVPGQRLVEVRWTGNRLFVSEKNPTKPHIWSSVTLYTTDVIRQREGWFTAWQQQNQRWSVVTIRQFHKVGDGDSHNSLLMNRQNQYCTVSLTSVLHTSEQTELLYEDLIHPTAVCHNLSTLSNPHRYAIA
ncbi:MAG: NRDE family protein [Bacteroidetes bacterium]|nr:NRDE family protein [Fibrella sp.]